MEVWEIQKAYNRWWLDKYMEDGRKIIHVRYVGNKVYGVVELTLDDHTRTFAPQSPNDYRPRKKNLKVFDELPT